MKIGILTYHAACNFGANLQALSTFSYFRNNGYEPIFINWMTKQLEERYRKCTPPIQFAEHEFFRKQYFVLTDRCYTSSDIAKVVKNERIEAIIVGSDAVMQTRPLRSRIKKPTIHHPLPLSFPTKDTISPNPFWGSFYSKLENVVPMCYMSASSQNSPYYKSSFWEKRKQSKLLEQFSYISTRDDWTSKQVSWLTDGMIVPPVTPDPVFAFNHNVKDQPSEDYIRQRFNLKGNYCLVCFHRDLPVSEDWLIKLKQEQQKRGVECVAFPFPQGIEFNHPFDKQIELPLSPMDWYALIKYASSYIGDNMHPIVICLHNAVPCYSFDHYGLSYDDKSSKVYHIMNLFGVLHNRVAYKYNYTEPSVDHVLSCINDFNQTQVKTYAENYLNQYLHMMSDITHAISK